VLRYQAQKAQKSPIAWYRFLNIFRDKNGNC
jgi:hypothetical protein